MTTWCAIDPMVVSHGPLLVDEPAPQSVSTYATTYLHLRLAPPDQTTVIEIVHPGSLRIHLGLVHAAQRAGRDVAGVAPRLVDLADPRVVLVDLERMPAAARPGAEVVAEVVNAVWGTSYTAATVGAALAIGLPPA